MTSIESEIELNNKQARAARKFDSFLSQSQRKFFYLFGFAGTGKTFLISHLIHEALSNDKIDVVMVCAPTNVALSVLESYFRARFRRTDPKYLKRIEFMTIHRLLGFKASISNETGEKIFNPKKNSKNKTLSSEFNKLVIIDECSMISSSMVAEIDKYVNLYEFKIVFLGDSSQLPPVSEDISPIFTRINDKYEYHILLDEIMRTKSSGIKKISKIIRKYNHNSKLDDLVDVLIPIHKIKSRSSDERPFKMFHKKKDYKNSTWFKYVIKKINSKCPPIILTWRNNTSDMYNRIIREEIHKTSNLDNYLENDYMIFNNYYESRKISDEIPCRIFYTSNIVKIVSIDSYEKKLVDWAEYLIKSPSSLAERAHNTLLKKLDIFETKYKIDRMIVNYIHDGVIKSKKYVIDTITRSELESYKENIRLIKEHIEHFHKKHKVNKVTSKLWKLFHTLLIDPYANINFSYSITTHKAQGSTYAIAVVDFEDITLNPNKSEMTRALYTATARASDELIFLL